jgi:hypothetical protein
VVNLQIDIRLAYQPPVSKIDHQPEVLATGDQNNTFISE